MQDESRAWELEQFDRCKPWIRAGLEASPLKTHAIEHIREGIAGGWLQIWPTPNSVCITEISTYPSGLKILNGLIAGGKLDEILDTILALEDYATLAGCRFTTMIGREGWLRAVPGYRRAYSTFYKEC